MEFLIDNNVSICFLTETWLTENNNSTTAIIKSYGFNILHVFRDNTKGGGVGIVFKKELKFTRANIKSYTTFENVCIRFRAQNKNYLLSTIYRTGNMGTFMVDFDDFLQSIFLSYDHIIICGDINIHLDSTDKTSLDFMDILHSYGLIQHVSDPTHKSNHIIDVVISSHQLIAPKSISISHEMSTSFPTCDHYPIFFKFNNIKCETGSSQKTITFRNLKSVNWDCFRHDLTSALESCDSKILSGSFSNAINYFNTSCTSVIDKHAPLLTKSIRDLPHSPWFDSEYKNLRKLRRRAERLWLKTKSLDDKEKFIVLRKETNSLAHTKKKSFFTSNFNRYNNSQKSLYAFANNFLDKSNELILPSANPDQMQDVADKFNNFFTEKIEKIRGGLETCQSYTTTNDYNTDNFTGAPLTKFDPATLSELKEVLTESTIKTSSNDPFPLDVTKENMDILLPHILNIVNLSLSSGSIDGLKTAHISPLIKGSTLDIDKLINYRPISNLSFIGKIIERIVLRRLNKHLTINNLHKDNQSGYKKFHSTDTNRK